MDPKKKEARKFRKSSSSDSSSTSSSCDDDSCSSSSSSSDSRHKKRHYRKRRDSSSSCDDSHGKKSAARLKKASEKKLLHKKSSHGTKIRKKSTSTHLKKRSLSPSSKSAHKHHVKVKMSSSGKKEKVLPPDQIELRDKIRMREKERQRSRTPRSKPRSRSPNRRLSPRREGKKERTPERRVSSPSCRFRPGSSRQRSPDKAVARTSMKEGIQPVRRHDSSKDRERRDRDLGKDKEHGELLTKERQRERERKERMKRERSHEDERHKTDRLLPRPSERMRMLNASRVSPDKMGEHERSRSASRGRSLREYDRGYEHMEHEEYVMRTSRDNASPYLRERKMEYEMERGYDHRDDRRMPPYEERHRREEWDEHDERGRMYERPQQMESREWEREMPPKRMEEGYKEMREWGDRSWSDQDKWAKDKDPKEWKQYNERGWNDPQVPPHKRMDHVPTGVPSHQGPGPHPRRWPHVPVSKEGHIEPYRRILPAGPPHTMKPTEHMPPQGPYKRHPNPFHFASATYKRFHYKRHAGLNPKYNPQGQIRGRMMINSTPPQSSAQSPVMMAQKAPAKVETVTESPHKKVETPTESANVGENKDEGVVSTEGNVEADTTIGEGGQDEDNLSNVSDSDDEILNREEENAANAKKTSEAVEDADNNLETSHEEGQIEDGEESRDNKDISKIHANKELKKEMDLDFEEISDGELEEETKNKGIGDALGVDWASLAKETSRPVVDQLDETYDSIKTRWTPHRILWDIGISVNLAGEEFARKTLLEARELLRQEQLEKKKKIKTIKKEEEDLEGTVKVKQEPDEKPENLAITIKQEPMDTSEETVPIKQEENNEEKVQSDDEDELLLNTEEDVIAHPLANMQVFMRKMKMQRRKLIMNATGKYGRALSARQDLKIRRQLCNLPSKEIFVDRNCNQNNQLKQQVDQIFQKLINAV